MGKRETGQFGENLAVKYLTKSNYRIISRNFHSRFGEIDIIATNHNQLVFIEVKTRRSDIFGTPSQALDHRKFRRIYKTALQFLHSSSLYRRHSWRIDLIAIELSRKPKLTHYKNVDGS